jgi:hypothetical protein
MLANMVIVGVSGGFGNSVIGKKCTNLTLKRILSFIKNWNNG